MVHHGVHSSATEAAQLAVAGNESVLENVVWKQVAGHGFVEPRLSSVLLVCL